MIRQKSICRIIALWLGWAIVVILFQAYIFTRVQLQRPDTTMEWTVEHTQPASLDAKINPSNLFLFSHAKWDSNYYVSIASHGYGYIGLFNLPSGKTLSTDYAFLPFYPLMTRIVATPLLWLGFNLKKVIVLSGIVVSLLGTLAGLLGLFDLSKQHLGENGAFRTCFYLLIFPTSMFLAQVYTEGLFIGLTLVSLALIQRGKYLPAAILAIFATMTRSVGILLAIPIALPILQNLLETHWNIRGIGRYWKNGLYSLFPILTFTIWHYSWLGRAFSLVERYMYGRGILQIAKTWEYLKYAAHSSHNPQTASYFLVEFGIVFLSLVACVFTLKKYPGISLFSFASICISLSSGVLISQSRYMVTAPAIFLFLGELGQSELFDRVFSMVSVLFFGVFLTLFTFGFWAG